MAAAQDSDEVLSLLGDEYVRTILVAASEEPMSAKELSEACDSSLATVYRRVEDCLEHDLLVEHTEIESDGSHHSVYGTAVDELTVEITEGGLAVSRHEREDVAGHFTRMWEDIRSA